MIKLRGKLIPGIFREKIMNFETLKNSPEGFLPLKSSLGSILSS